MLLLVSQENFNCHMLRELMTLTIAKSVLQAAAETKLKSKLALIGSDETAMMTAAINGAIRQLEDQLD